MSAPFSYAEIRPYAIADSLSELCGPEHGVLGLPRELAWSGRRRFDLDDDYDRAAVYKIILEEGREEHFRRFLNAGLLLRNWREVMPARRVRALWESRFPELRGFVLGGGHAIEIHGMGARPSEDIDVQR